MIPGADIVGRLAAGPRVPVLTRLTTTPWAATAEPEPEREPRGRRRSRRLNRLTARRFTTHFHALSAGVKDGAVHAFGVAPDRITIVEGGRDPRDLGEPSAARRADARTALGLADDEVV